MSVATLLDLCRRKGLRLASAESCTGGLLGAWLTEVAGSSDVYECGFITYSNNAKINMLGVSPASLTDHGAVSEVVAREMAIGAQARSGVDIAVSITGIAGPGASDHKPEGRVCFGLANGADCHSETVEFGALGRDLVRQAAANHALTLLKDAAGD